MAIKACEIYALDLLARREHSGFELKQKLCVKNFASDEIAAVLEILKQKGFQSDERFAERSEREDDH